VLGNCTQLTSVDFHNCYQITGGCCLEERSFPRLRPSAQFFKKFLLSESCSNFLEWLAELGENSWNFSRSIQTPSLTHTCPACVSIQFHTGDIQVLGNCKQLRCVDFYFCKKITGGCCFEERSFSRLRSSPHLVPRIFLGGILRIFSRVADICTTNKRK